jgi:putative flippase GtrA
MEENKFLTKITTLPGADFVRSHAQFVKFAITGGLASITHIGLLVYFTEVLNMWYVGATSLGFVGAFGVSFTLQKYWTFQEHSGTRLPKQAFAFFALQMVNLVANAILMYVAVDLLRAHYLVAQVIVLAILALSTFVVSKKLIFRSDTLSVTSHTGPLHTERTHRTESSLSDQLPQ